MQLLLLQTYLALSKALQSSLIILFIFGVRINCYLIVIDLPVTSSREWATDLYLAAIKLPDGLASFK